MMQIGEPKSFLKTPHQTGLSELSTHLSTPVHGFMWINVENLCIKTLARFFVDN
nr:hypothetical protein [Candidatus Cloacimonadota bacterium]